MGVGAQAGVALGGQLLELGDEAAVLIEQFLSVVALQPLLEQVQMLGDSMVRGTWWARKEPSICLPSTTLGPVQPLGVRSTIMGHTGRSALLFSRAFFWMALISSMTVSHGLGHELVHGHGVVALDEVRLPAAALEEALDLLVGDTGEDGGVANLVAVQVQDGQHGAIGDGVEELVGLPRGGQGAGLGFAVAHKPRWQSGRGCQHSAESVGNGVAQLAALVDGAGGPRGRSGWERHRGRRTA